MQGRVSTWRAVTLLSVFLLVGLAGCTRDKPLTTPEPWTTGVAPAGSEPTATPLPPLLLTPSTDEQPPASSNGGGGSPAPTTGNGNPPVDLSNTTSYTVQAGDTLAAIARQFNTDVDTLMRLNSLTNATILVNQVLRVPGGGGAPVAGPATTSGNTYIVQGGDTLASIARALGVDIQELIRVNGITNPDTIFPGQVLQIPGSGSGTVQTAGTGEGRNYTVQAGDTLRSIAVQFGITVQDILAVNNIPDPDNIHPGDVIRIP